MGDRTTVSWEETKSALRRLIRKGVEFCTLEGTMVESDAHTYLSSGKNTCTGNYKINKLVNITYLNRSTCFNIKLLLVKVNIWL